MGHAFLPKSLWSGVCSAFTSAHAVFEWFSIGFIEFSDSVWIHFLFWEYRGCDRFAAPRSDFIRWTMGRFFTCAPCGRGWLGRIEETPKYPATSLPISGGAAPRRNLFARFSFGGRTPRSFFKFESRLAEFGLRKIKNPRSCFHNLGFDF